MQVRIMAIKNEAYGWRKYECPVPIGRHTGGEIDISHDGYLIWYGQDHGQYKHLNRWMSMEDAFLGFISRGYGPPIAVAYSIDKVAGLLATSALMSRLWIPGADAAEAVEFISQCIAGVWMGEKTPFLISVSGGWDSTLRQITPLFVL